MSKGVWEQGDLQPVLIVYKGKTIRKPNKETKGDNHNETHHKGN